MKPRALAPRLWIDLTGNALSALSIKLAGAKNLAARITRGGRSLVDYALPHSIQENEYVNRGRIAQELGCTSTFPWLIDCAAMRSLDSRISSFCVSQRLHVGTTGLCQFPRLIERFPKSHFVLIGLRRKFKRKKLTSRRYSSVIQRPERARYIFDL